MLPLGKPGFVSPTEVAGRGTRLPYGRGSTHTAPTKMGKRLLGQKVGLGGVIFMCSTNN